MTIFGAYFPSTDHQIEEFDSYLQQLENTIIANNNLDLWWWQVILMPTLDVQILSRGSSCTNIQGQS